MEKSIIEKLLSGEEPTQSYIQFTTINTSFLGTTTGQPILAISGWFGFYQITYVKGPGGGYLPELSEVALTPKKDVCTFNISQDLLNKLLPGMKISDITCNQASKIVMQIFEKYLSKVPAYPERPKLPSIEELIRVADENTVKEDVKTQPTLPVEENNPYLPMDPNRSLPTLESLAGLYDQNIKSFEDL